MTAVATNDDGTGDRVLATAACSESISVK